MWLRRLLHWGPIIALTVIGIAVYGTISGMMIALKDPETRLLHISAFSFIVVMLLLNYLLAMYRGPGFTPAGWAPATASDQARAQYCLECEAYKSPRAHHCSSCNRCVCKMDHHCPWINGCVGYNNHKPFVLFLIWTPLGGIYATAFLSYYFYWLYSINRIVFKNFTLMVHPNAKIFPQFMGLAFAVAVVIAVGILCFVQLRNILKNCSEIEEWIVSKADRPREKEFVYPYDLGWKRNFTEVFGPYHQWLNPFGYKQPGDGLTWPVVAGCDQYTFTEEQLAQKKLKRSKARDCEAVADYNGRCLSCSHGIRIACEGLCTFDERRLELKKGDKISVSRIQSRWSYGEKFVYINEKKKKRRGWFPTSAAVIVSNEDNEQDGNDVDARPDEFGCAPDQKTVKKKK